MPSLNWIGKEKIVNHDKEVPFRLMRKNKKYSLGESENLILEGDNLEALKALMPFYYGEIKCIYIDPPYNTGNEKWVYNDKVNSPKIKEWLGKVVGPEGEDLTRHDKWLCMMYPRLKLLRDLLSDDGVIFVSIDDNEYCYLKQILDDIFGSENFLANIIWQKVYSPRMDAKSFSVSHDYIVVYGKSKNALPNKVFFEQKKEQFKFYDAKKKKYYRRRSWRKEGKGSLKADAPSLFFPIIAPDGTKVYPIKPNGVESRWRGSKETYQEYIKKGIIEWVRGKKEWEIYIKQYYEGDAASPPVTLWLHEEVGHNHEANDEIRGILGGRVFENPKPVRLIKKILKVGGNKNSIILDSFAGSGTTVHAVLELNKEDGGNRKFILVEMEKNIAKKITAERVKRVARGYSYKTGKGKQVKVTGLGGGFEYVELGEPLFDKDGMISKAVSFEDMARYVYFTETRTNLEKKNIKENYLGEFGGNHYFLLFDGIGKNVLNRKFLKELKPYKDKKIIYADKCLIDEEVLEKHQIVFKQIPYEVKIY